MLLVRTLLVRVPVMVSSVLAVEAVLRFGATLITSLRCARALTTLAGTTTVSARVAPWRLRTEPPLLSTKARSSAMS